MADETERTCQVCGTDGKVCLEAAAHRDGNTITVTLKGRFDCVTVNQVGINCCLEICEKIITLSVRFLMV